MKIQVNARNRAYHFEAVDSERVLFAGLRHGIGLPYECSTGTCGTCKARLIKGELDDRWPAAPGRKYLKDPAEFLMCQCAVRGDCTVELSGFVDPLDPGTCRPDACAGIIRRVRPLTQDVVSLDIELATPRDFDAGQFMVVEAPGVPGFRAYSMVNYERQARRLEFVIKRKPGGGFSEWLFGENREGAELRVVGPLGHATFYPAIGKNILCIAGGTGVAGMMSILARGTQERYFDQYRGDVFFGVRTFADAFYLDELSAYRESFPDNLRITVALSDEDVPESAARKYPQLTFRRGLVHEVAGKEMEGRYQNVRAYLAGPPPAVDAAIRTLIVHAKLTTDHIVYDKFS
jgi:toluene monooxygenase electron transfer component